MVTDRIYRLLQSLPSAQRQFRRLVKRLPHRRRLVRHHGCEYEIDPSELHGFYLYYEREYDDPVFAYLRTRLGEFRWGLDIGANIGIYTAFLARHLPRVDAFEPEPSVLPLLEANLARNQVANVIVHKCCVGDVNGSVSFHRPSEENRGVGGITAGAGHAVACVTLDQFLETVPQDPLFIKMDIEGGEWLAVRGGARVLAGWPAPIAILIEIHPHEITQLGGAVPALRNLLTDAGLTVRALAAGMLSEQKLDEARFWWAERSIP